MNLGGFALAFAALIAGGSGGAHSAAGHDLAARAQSAAGGSLSPSGTTGVLTQTGADKWQARVLMDDSKALCAGSAAYWLQFTVPGHPGEAPVSGTAKATPKPLPASPTSGSSCEMTVTFSNAELSQVPITAALDVDQAGTSSAITLTVSRTVTLYYYLGLPAIVGGASVVVTLLLALCLVRLYDARGGLIRRRTVAYWVRPLTASGAWTLNDSWATNITAVFTLLATVLGVTTATAALFPGVAVDRFVIVNIVAGGFVVVAPLAFGIFYAIWTRRNPGVMADATLTLPTANSAKLACRSVLRLSAPTAVVLAPGGTRKLARGTELTVARATTIELGQDSTTSLGTGTRAAVPGGAQATLARDARLRTGRWWMLLSGRRPTLPRGTAIHLPGGAQVTIGPAEVELRGDGSAALADDCGAKLRTKAKATGAGHMGTLRRTTRLTLSRGTVVTPPTAARVTLADAAQVTLPAGTWVRVSRATAAQWGPPPQTDRVTVAARAAATSGTGISVRLADVAGPPSATITLPSGADLALPGGATVTARDDSAQQAVTVKPGHTVHVPPRTCVSILGGTVMTVPGTSDITVDALSTLDITAHAGHLAISADDIVPPTSGKAEAKDAAPSYPVRIAVPSGAKLTVAGVVDITLPKGTMSKAPYRRDFSLPRERSLQVPPGSNVLFGNLWMILATAVFTMFGIGAEIGIAAILAYGLSEASLAWRSAMLGVTGLVAVLVIVYAATAIRAIADPRPGSSISATGGTSFTL
jgi:hypothetical protein